MRFSNFFTPDPVYQKPETPVEPTVQDPTLTAARGAKDQSAQEVAVPVQTNAIIQLNVTQSTVPKRANPNLDKLRIASAIAGSDQIRSEIEAERKMTPILELPAFAPEPAVETVVKAELPEGLKITGAESSIQGFLPEIKKILTLGKELDLLLLQRKDMSSVNEKAKLQSQEATNQATLVRDSMLNFLNTNSPDESKDALANALNAYESFLSAFLNEQNNNEGLLRVADNELVVRINKAKKQISDILKEVGGMNNLDEIKKVFRAFNVMRTNEIGYDSQIVKEAASVLDRENNPQDAAVFKALAERGDIVGLLQAVYGKDTIKN